MTPANGSLPDAERMTWNLGPLEGQIQQILSFSDPAAEKRAQCSPKMCQCWMLSNLLHFQTWHVRIKFRCLLSIEFCHYSLPAIPGHSLIIIYPVTIAAASYQVTFLISWALSLLAHVQILCSKGNRESRATRWSKRREKKLEGRGCVLTISLIGRLLGGKPTGRQDWSKNFKRLMACRAQMENTTKPGRGEDSAEKILPKM